MSKSVLYIDVDDTIIAEHRHGKGWDLRPNVMSQLRILSRLFDCRWLTYWPHQDINTLMRSLYSPVTARNMGWTEWKRTHEGSKAKAVLAGNPDFFWLENPLDERDRDLLYKSGNQWRFFEVKPHGNWEFTKAANRLLLTKNFTDNDIKRVDGDPAMFMVPLDDAAVVTHERST